MTETVPQRSRWHVPSSSVIGQFVFCTEILKQLAKRQAASVLLQGYLTFTYRRTHSDNTHIEITTNRLDDSFHKSRALLLQVRPQIISPNIKLPVLTQFTMTKR